MSFKRKFKRESVDLDACLRDKWLFKEEGNKDDPDEVFKKEFQIIMFDSFVLSVDGYGNRIWKKDIKEDDILITEYNILFIASGDKLTGFDVRTGKELGMEQFDGTIKSMKAGVFNYIILENDKEVKIDKLLSKWMKSR